MVDQALLKNITPVWLCLFTIDTKTTISPSRWTMTEPSILYAWCIDHVLVWISHYLFLNFFVFLLALNVKHSLCISTPPLVSKSFHLDEFPDTWTKEESKARATKPFLFHISHTSESNYTLKNTLNAFIIKLVHHLVFYLYLLQFYTLRTNSAAFL